MLQQFTKTKKKQKIQIIQNSRAYVAGEEENQMVSNHSIGFKELNTIFMQSALSFPLNSSA